MWWKIVAIIFVIIVCAIAAAILNGTSRWKSDTRELIVRMEESQVPFVQTSYDPHELKGLPLPVQRYFRTALKEGQQLILGVKVEHTGTFNMSLEEEQWKPFSSNQSVVIRRPGFIWDARIRMAPLFGVYIKDAYVAGQGILEAKLLGLLTVMKQPDTPELAQGELMRFLAEAAWYPTALLPSQGVVWEAMDDTHARATLKDGSTIVELVFQFDHKGLISSVRSDGRYREVDKKLVAVPWQGRFWDYEVREGLLIPLEGEVSWILPEGLKPYWRGSIRQIEYEYAQ